MVAAPVPSPTLQRHVEPVRRRRRWWWALAATAAANAALTVALDRRRPSTGFSVELQVEAATPAVPAPAMPAPAPVVVQVPTPVASVVAPPPPPAPFADLGPCPGPAISARRPVHQPETDAFLVGVAAAPTDSRWIAAWTGQYVFVSRDGGGTWDRVLDGAGDVLDAAFDCHGRVLVLRAEAGLGVRAGAHERWRPIDGVALTRPDADGGDADTGYRPRLVGGGRGLAVLGAVTSADGDAQVAVISDDLGASWRTVDLGWDEHADLAAAWTGATLRVAVPWTDCMTEGLRLVTVTPSGTRTSEIDASAADVALAGATLVAGGQACAEAGLGPSALCTWRRGRGWKPVAAPPGEPEQLDLLDGPVDVVVADDAVYPIRGTGLGRGRPWSRAWRALSVDRAGRVWGLDDRGALVRS